MEWTLFSNSSIYDAEKYAVRKNVNIERVVKTALSLRLICIQNVHISNNVMLHNRHTRTIQTVWIADNTQASITQRNVESC